MSIIEALDEYRRDFPWPPPDVIAMECFGFYGYGDGRVVSGQATGPPLSDDTTTGPDGRTARKVVGGCTACPRQTECWQVCVGKAREMMPELMEVHDEIVATGVTGQEFVAAWQRETDQEVSKHFIPPPPMLLNIENMKHGAWHTVGKKWDGTT